MTDQKVIEKIKKLLELTTSPNEHEASLAMDQAKKLMLKHSINESNYLNSGVAPEIINEVYSNPIFGKHGVKEAIAGIITTIAPIFGCHGFTKKEGNFRSYYLMGFKTNIEITKFGLDSLLAQGAIDARREYKKFRTVTFGLSFWSGFSDGLNTKFGKVKDQTETGIELYDKVKEKLNEKCKGTFSPDNYSGVAREIGFRSGTDAQIRSGIATQSSGKLIQ